MLSLTPEENSNSGIVTYQEDNDKCLNGLEFAVSCFSKKRVTRNFELNQNFEVLYNIFTKYCTCRVTRVVVSIVTRVVVSIVTRVVVSIVTRVVVSIAAFSFYSKLSNCSWQSLIIWGNQEGIPLYLYPYFKWMGYIPPTLQTSWKGERLGILKNK